VGYHLMQPIRDLIKGMLLNDFTVSKSTTVKLGHSGSPFSPSLSAQGFGEGQSVA
jgi:hypothetical protein